MKPLFAAGAAGFLFGLGLWISGMANPKKVLGFLDVAGNWDASLLLVMASAVAVTFIGFRIFKTKLQKPTLADIDLPLVAGAALFGLGWGIGGYCPGPALTAFATLSGEALAFVAAMIAGGLLHTVGSVTQGGGSS